MSQLYRLDYHQKEKSLNLFHSKIKTKRLQEEHNLYPSEYQQFVCITYKSLFAGLMVFICSEFP